MLSTNSIDIRSRLRNVTQPLHSELNNHPILSKLLTPELELEDYIKLIRLFFTFYETWESGIDRFMNNHSLDFDYTARRKTDWLKQDMKYFKQVPIDPIPENTTNQCEINSIGQLIGSLYVIEGSTLGGQLISRQLFQNKQLSYDSGARFFYGYGEMTDGRWREFLSFCNCISDIESECLRAEETAKIRFAELIGTIKRTF